jgi:hypothetical protein
LLRWRYDARVFKPLLIEIIPREKVAPTLEPQKVSRRTTPASKCNAMDGIVNLSERRAEEGRFF